VTDQPLAEEVRAVAERAARTSYGRLVAILASGTKDIALAEDALADAFERALRTWPAAGVPTSPEGWLLTVARNRQSDVLGSAARRLSDALPDDATLGSRTASRPLDDLDPEAIPDKRLELLFACAHPAIDAGVRTPLMLQTVLGFEAAQIAEAFAVPGPTMAQRLVRAKRRIRDAGIPFAVPDRSQMPSRLAPVLEAVYGCFAIDWRGSSAPTVRESMAAEAQYLAVTLAQLLQDEPEAWGLAARITLSLARAAGRDDDAFVPLDEQDARSWDAAMIAEGDLYLVRASAARGHDRPVGRFELEAAIESVHSARATTGGVDWSALRTLHEALVTVAPTLGARVALAAATSHVDGAGAGLAVLDAIGDPAVGRFQPAWATRAALLAETGDTSAAAAAYDKAISLTTDAPTRRWLEGRRAALTGRAPGAGSDISPKSGGTS
jgi:RNA polymerase sigma-70 factor (ECF subfamily)